MRAAFNVGEHLHTASGVYFALARTTLVVFGLFLRQNALGAALYTICATTAVYKLYPSMSNLCQHLINLMIDQIRTFVIGAPPLLAELSTNILKWLRTLDTNKLAIPPTCQLLATSSFVGLMLFFKRSLASILEQNAISPRAAIFLLSGVWNAVIMSAAFGIKSASKHQFLDQGSYVAFESFTKSLLTSVTNFPCAAFTHLASCTYATSPVEGIIIAGMGNCLMQLVRGLCFQENRTYKFLVEDNAKNGISFGISHFLSSRLPEPPFIFKFLTATALPGTSGSVQSCAIQPAVRSAIDHLCAAGSAMMLAVGRGYIK